MKKMYKIFINVPSDFTEKLISAMSEAGAGVIGNYTHCAFITKGVGTAKPKEGANPYTGMIDEMYHEPEDRIEMPCEIDKLESVVEAIKKVHPYETPIIEVLETTVYTK